MRLIQFVTIVASLALGVVPAHAEGPTYRVDAAWQPQIPADWALGPVSGVAIDAQDHVWILQRPTWLTQDEKGLIQDPPVSKCCRPAPPVIELDRNGKVLRAWGGPSEDYDWPKSGHGILVDHEGNVWITGADSDDGMILKFTPDGQLIKQIGGVGPSKGSLDTTIFTRATGFTEDPDAREIYVSDGYANNRVVVLDLDTLQVKRFWGAYGKPPTDDDIPPYNAESPQFDTVHCVERGSDGLIYVCDRLNNRIQVFRPDGTYLHQFVFEPATRGPGSAWDIAMSARDPDYMMLADGSNNEMSVWRLSDGKVVQTFGRQGRYAGQFHWVHNVAVDSRGDVYTTEVDTGKRIQKWIRQP